MHRQVFAEPPPLRLHREDVSEPVEKVVLRGLAKAPDTRYQSAGQFAAALRGGGRGLGRPPREPRDGRVARAAWAFRRARLPG